MNQPLNKKVSKAATVALAGVGAAAVQSGSAKVAPSPAIDVSQQAVAAPLATPQAAQEQTEILHQAAFVERMAPVTDIEQLVETYLEQSPSHQFDAETLSELEDLDQMPGVAEALQALVAQPGVELAQVGGGIGSGNEPTDGDLNTFGVIGGAIVGGALVNELLNDGGDDSNGTA
jgi:hypothetical protein